jgi:hypothetical protein
MAAVCMTQRRLKRHGNSGWADIYDLHLRRTESFLICHLTFISFHLKSESAQ